MAFNCYIDETGDDGIGTGGTRWFMLGAVIVPEENDYQTSNIIPEIKKVLNKKPEYVLRWSKIRHHDKRVRICTELMKEKWEFSCVLADKTHPNIQNADGLHQKWYLYFYSTRLLAERLSWYARDHGGQKAKLIFEKRNMSYDELIGYFGRLFNGECETQIKWNHIDWEGIKIIPKGENRMLQAADLVVGATSEGFEHTPLGNIEPRYILSMKDRFYRKGNNLFSYGLKFLHVKGDSLKCHQDEYSWLTQL